MAERDSIGHRVAAHKADAAADKPLSAAHITAEPIIAEPIIAEPITTAELRTTPILADNASAGAPMQTRDASAPAAPSLQAASISEIYGELLHRLGEDPTRDGLRRTPDRMERSLGFLTRGYGQNLSDVLGSALFDVDYDEMVIVRDIEFYSLCEHHMLPFFGRAHIAYIPQGKVIGLSKLPRVVDMFARRLQVQERLTRQIADAIIDSIQPQGVGVILEAQHLCMMMRGVEKQSSMTTTSAMLGVFRSQVQTRNEFLSLVRRPGSTT